MNEEEEEMKTRERRRKRKRGRKEDEGGRRIAYFGLLLIDVCGPLA